MKLLVDECLSEELTKLAQNRGHLDASHVRWIGKGGAKDWELTPLAASGHFPIIELVHQGEHLLKLLSVVIQHFDFRQVRPPGHQQDSLQDIV